MFESAGAASLRDAGVGIFSWCYVPSNCANQLVLVSTDADTLSGSRVESSDRES